MLKDRIINRAWFNIHKKTLIDKIALKGLKCTFIYYHLNGDIILYLAPVHSKHEHAKLINRVYNLSIDDIVDEATKDVNLDILLGKF